MNKIIIGMVSCVAYADRRQACELFWAKNLRESHGITVMHIVADIKQEEDFKLIDQNILSVKCSDGYGYLPYKTAMFYKWVNENREFDYILKCDDDTYFFEKNLLEEFNNLSKDYYGFKMQDEYASGCAYFLSRKAVNLIVNNLDQFLTQGFEDKMFGEFLFTQGINVCIFNPYDKVVPSLNFWVKNYNDVKDDPTFLGEEQYFKNKMAVHLHRFSVERMQSFHEKYKHLREQKS
jgi:Galactosyltransferase